MLKNYFFWKKQEKGVVIKGSQMNLIETCVDRTAVISPQKLALVFENKKRKIEYTYSSLLAEVNKFANLLKDSGVEQNSRVFIFLPKCPEMYISCLGTIKHGSIAAPLFEAFQEDGLELRLTRGDAEVLITNKELFKRLPKDFKNKIPTLKYIFIVDSKEYKDSIKARSPVFSTVMKNKNDTAMLIFTSSTAGTPVAGVQVPHYGIVQQYFTAKLVLDLKPEDNYWCTAHPGWVTGSIYGILAPLSIGCTTYIYEEHFDARDWIKFLVKRKISVIYTAPTALRLLKPKIKQADLKSVRNIVSVGEALNSSIFEHYKQLGIEINDSYWQTETGAMIIATWPGLAKKTGSMGKAIPGIKARIINGAIAIKPSWPSMMTGIYKHPELYKSYFKGWWFTTNDGASIDSEGYFFFVGRKDDIIKTGGERVSPIEVESALIKHKAVKEAAVIGIPDEIKGNILKAFVILNEGVKPSPKLKEELSLFVKENYAGHSYPKEIEFVRELPKTNSGKIIRMKLREENK